MSIHRYCVLLSLTVLLLLAGCTGSPGNVRPQGEYRAVFDVSGSGAPLPPYGDVTNITVSGDTVHVTTVLGKYQSSNGGVTLGPVDRSLPANWTVTVLNDRPTYRGDNPAVSPDADAVSVAGDAPWQGTIPAGERKQVAASITIHSPGIYAVRIAGVINASGGGPGFCCGIEHAVHVLYNGARLLLSRSGRFCPDGYRLNASTLACTETGGPGPVGTRTDAQPPRQETN